MSEVKNGSNGISEQFYYLAYGANLHPTLLASRLGPTKPLSSTPVIVPSAFLSFDVQGVPFTSPACTNAIVQGVNDFGWSSAPIHSDLSQSEKEANPEYREWVWRRCCPGLEYTGDLPPRLEGVAFQLTEPHFRSIMEPEISSFSSSSTTGSVEEDNARSRAAWPVLPIECRTFSPAGDSDRPTGTLIAYIPIAPTSIVRQPNLQPSTEYLRLVMIGAFSSLLSQPYLGHLVLLRPYLPTASLGKRFARFLINAIMIPPFLFVHLPLRAMGFGAKESVVARVTDRVVGQVVRGAERWLRTLFGSGWWNENEVFDASSSVSGKREVEPQEKVLLE